MKMVYDENAAMDVLRLNEIKVCFAELDLSTAYRQLLESGHEECLRIGIRRWIVEKMSERFGKVEVAEESDVNILGDIKDGVEITEGYYCSFDVTDFKLRLFFKEYNAEWTSKN